jgi:hypothetical protein
VLDPATKGKVVLETTAGPIDIELFSRECPLACRNFVQLCMEGENKIVCHPTHIHPFILLFLYFIGDQNSLIPYYKDISRLLQWLRIPQARKGFHRSNRRSFGHRTWGRVDLWWRCFQGTYSIFTFQLQIIILHFLDRASPKAQV